MNAAVKPFIDAQPQPSAPLTGIMRRLTGLFDDWCDLVAPCPWTATAGRRATPAQAPISSHS